VRRAGSARFADAREDRERIDVPKVSVIMPVFNREAHVRASIDSVLAQSFTDFEFIIVDDGSTDATRGVIDSYDDARIVTASLPVNCGISAARNLGLALAGGELIALIDSDDVAMPNRLAEQASFMDQHRDVDILGTGIVKLVGSDERPQQHPADDGVIKASLLVMNGSAISNGTAMMRRAFLEKHDLSYRNVRIDEDHALWIDAMRAGAKFRNLEAPLIYSRRHEGNITAESGPDWLKFQAQKTPLRAELLGLWFPDLSFQEAWALARFMEFNARLEIEEVGLGLATAARVARYRENRFGASLPHINSIVLESCHRVRKLLSQALKRP
jgi:hypothetical protein